MYVCVCVCVCPAACRRTHTSYHPEIWRELLISHGLGTKPGGNPKCQPPGVPPILTLSEIPWRVKKWVGASKQKLLLGVGLPCKILFVGGSPKPGACRVHPTKWGCMLWELGGGQQTKVAPRGGFVHKYFICGGLTPTQSPQGPTINLHGTFS
jgi:hypothetical protein